MRPHHSVHPHNNMVGSPPIILGLHPFNFAPITGFARTGDSPIEMKKKIAPRIIHVAPRQNMAMIVKVRWAFMV